jgi:hypothetical protein
VITFPTTVTVTAMPGAHVSNGTECGPSVTLRLDQGFAIVLGDRDTCPGCGRCRTCGQPAPEGDALYFTVAGR